MLNAAANLVDCLRFWSRLPLPADPTGRVPDFGRIVAMLPAAGLVIALPACAILLIADGLSLPPLVAGGLAVAALCLTTGALHEDGLADTADGFVGGADRERRLAIMRDSRIGAFGTIALILSLGLRAGAIAALFARSPALAALALLAGAAFSRTAGLLPLALLPPARTDGAGFMAAQPMSGLRIAAIVAGVFALLPLLAGASLGRTLFAGLAATGAAWTLVPLARRKIGGQTGDVAGASQQAADVVYLALLSGAA